MSPVPVTPLGQMGLCHFHLFCVSPDFLSHLGQTGAMLRVLILGLPVTSSLTWADRDLSQLCSQNLTCRSLASSVYVVRPGECSSGKNASSHDCKCKPMNGRGLSGPRWQCVLSMRPFAFAMP